MRRKANAAVMRKIERAHNSKYCGGSLQVLDARLTIITKRHLKNESVELTRQHRMGCRIECLAAVSLAIWTPRFPDR